MKSITSPLNTTDRGGAVANLQDALLLLLDKRLIQPASAGTALPQLLRTDQRTAVYGQGTVQAVTLFQQKHRLAATGVVDGPTADAINGFLQALDAVRPDADTVVFAVDGRVISRERAGVGGLRVSIVDRNVGDGRDVQLADTSTGADGSYRATFTVPGLGQRGKDHPDLQAVAFALDARLGASEVRYNAATHETLNIALTAAAATALPSELETLISDVSARFTGPLRDLKESADRRDITYLANKTGWDARAVALAALADQFSALTNDAGGAPQLEPAFFYALFRAGVPANQNALAQITPQTAAGIWKQAIAQGVIPSSLETRLPQATGHFHRLVVERTLTGPAQVGLSSLKEMLQVSLENDPARQQRFAELHAQHRNAPATLWEAVRNELGEASERRLRLDGQLAQLTRNNAPLMRKLHGAAGTAGLTDLFSLVEQGYYHAEKWRDLIGNDAIPADIAGDTDAERRARYTEVLAAQVRLSFPTMVVAQMVHAGETPMAPGRQEQVHAFLVQHQGKFEIGLHPVQRYIALNQLQVAADVSNEISRIQRAYQITPSDAAMNGLLRRGIDSARAVARYDREQFVRTFTDDLGGETSARLTHAKAQQVHNIVLNLAMSYLVARTAPQIGVHSAPKYSNTNPAIIAQAMEAVAGNQVKDTNTWLRDVFRTESPQNASDVIPYATLEALFGVMDFCACDHCRSVLSPAAYLVDLLQFLDRGDLGPDKNPLEILLDRRPDIEHLPLTCENTNTPLPYIDLVNETLEYFITNNLSLEAYKGHNTDGTIRAEELLASPQFVQDKAYETLAGQHEPNDAAPLLPPRSPLPFHRPLENLRRFFDKFDTPLPDVMELLRTNDDVERPQPADPANPIEYGWRDTLMEELRLSRAEYRLLTDRVITIQELYGFDPGDLESGVLNGWEAGPHNRPAWRGLSNARAFCRLMGISYQDIVDILKTRFVNPHSTLVPKLEKLGVPFSVLKAFKDGTMTPAQLDAFQSAIATVDLAEFGGNVKTWLDDDQNYARIMGLITLTDPTGDDKAGRFEWVELRYANPVASNQLRPFEFRRLFRFIRLWRKLGWTIDQTDKAIAALYPASRLPDSPDDAVNLQRLDAGFLTLLPRLGVVARLIRSLKLKPKKDLLPLLACFGPIDTHGASSLYRQMFLSPAPADKGSPFADDGFGNFLTTDAGLLAHGEALRAAFLLAEDELTEITNALGYDGSTPLGVNTVSAVFRRGWLARKLKLSVREFLRLVEVLGIDPFLPPDPPQMPMLRFLEIVWRLRGAGLKPEQALYAIWNRDISGKSAAASGDVLEFARTLRAAFAAIEGEFALADDPAGLIARARMALVYGAETTNVFFGFLDDTLVTEVEYDHDQETLQDGIMAAAGGRLTYDDLAKRLAYTGVMTEPARDALLGAGATDAFQQAVDSPDPEHHSLFGENQKVVLPFFDRYPELRPLYELYAFFGEPRTAGAIAAFFQDITARYPKLKIDQAAYIAAGASQPARRTLFLAAFLPELTRRRKRQQALAAVAATAKVDLPLASALLDDPLVLNPAVIPADGDLATLPSALDDLPAIERTGLSTRIYQSATLGPPDVDPDYGSEAEPSLAYPLTGQGSLPVTPASGIWTGYVEAPENGFYNFRIEPGGAGPGPASATLTIDGEDKPLETNGEIRSNATAIELRAGTLYPITVTAENLTAGLKVRWQTTGRGWEVIPQRYLYSSGLTANLATTYIRFLKAASLAGALKLTPGELGHLTSHQDYRIDGRGWLNSLPVVGSAVETALPGLLEAFEALLDFAALKTRFAPNDERLLAVLRDPTALMEMAGEAPDIERSALLALTRWDSPSLDALLLRFGKHAQEQPLQADRAALSDLGTFMRIHRSFGPVKKIGVSAEALISATTNEPRAPAVRVFKDALRARYEDGDWLSVLRPINDQLRTMQRDALVAYTLHHMRAHEDSEHIDTPEKLFEYFLMDVQMESCMQTSRIRHALSSVQLFTERCFMNLETGVAPEVFKPKHRQHWEWMKRYRVWEANRKVFLWPENWAEPELRTTQSPIFKEAMSELLQSDITEDRAAAALSNYLSKLDDVAKLEPCGMYFVEGDPGTADYVAHVVARTGGANRKYFYRRYDGLWSPWEPIKLDIDDVPVVPVVWKERLVLFWLKILKDMPPQAPPSLAGETLAGVDPSQMIPAQQPHVRVWAVLCWSEYYNGKWQPARTSDINNPVLLDDWPVDEFFKFHVRLPVFETESGELRVFVTYSYESWKSVKASFLLSTSHGVPTAEPVAPLDDVLAHYKDHQDRSLKFDEGTLAVMQYASGSADAHHDHVLSNAIGGAAIDVRHRLKAPWVAPFFYADRRHSFYVKPSKVFLPLHQSPSYGLEPGAVYGPIQQVVVPQYQAPGSGPIEALSSGLNDSFSTMQFVTEDAFIKKGVPLTSAVDFGGVSIGASGGVHRL